jgi:hypothetical protein
LPCWSMTTYSYVFVAVAPMGHIRPARRLNSSAEWQREMACS